MSDLSEEYETERAKGPGARVRVKRCEIRMCRKESETASEDEMVLTSMQIEELTLPGLKNLEKDLRKGLGFARRYGTMERVC